MNDDKTMQAIRIHAYGDTDQLVLENVARPEPAEGEVLVRIKAAGVNPVDWKTRKGGGVAGLLGDVFPLILGWDVSGEVAALGSGARGFQVGDEVYGMIRFPKPGGAYAQYATAPEAHLALKPRTVGHLDTAALPVAALTAWQALFDTAGLQAGQRVLIHAAAGGVGHIAVQLARWKGAYVVGTASKPNHGLVKELGADEVFDYTSGRFEDDLRDFDVVLDAVGPEVAARSYPVLRKGGMLVSITRSASAEEAARFFVRQENIMVRPDHEQLQAIAGLVDGGSLRTSIERVFPLNEARQAHELGEKGRNRGKIVLSIP